MTFGDALEQIKAGHRCKRQTWTFRDVIYAKYTKDMLPYLVIESPRCEPVPYTVTDKDLFANDWKVVPS